MNFIHNPTSGREVALSQTIPRAERPAKVVGGGPAGLEAARVSAEHGHAVTLLEAATKLGGQILIAAAVPERHDLIGIVDWHAGELERLDADVRLNTYADAKTVVAGIPTSSSSPSAACPISIGWMTPNCTKASGTC